MLYSLFRYRNVFAHNNRAMKFKNIRKLERLGVFTYIGGLICTLLGILVAGIHLIEKDFKHIQVGIFILAIGYAFVKTGRQLSEIAAEEKKIQLQS